LDSTFAPAYSALGYRYHQLVDYTNGQHDLLLEVERVEGRALALNPNLLSAIAELTALYTDIGRTEDAIRMARRALTIVPDDPGSLFFLGYAYRYAGLLDDAVRVQEQAVRIDPNPHFRSLAVTYIHMNRLDDALRALALDSASNFALFHRTDIALRRHRNAEALQTIDRLLAIESTGIFAELAHFYRAYLRRDADGMNTIIRSWKNRPFVDGEQTYGIASCIALAGDAHGAAEAIQSAVDHGFFCYPMMQTDPFLDPVRSDPAVQAALEHARSKYERFQRIVETLGPE
jgi:tetratricopeptide (TPR) repeat protein